MRSLALSHSEPAAPPNRLARRFARILQVCLFLALFAPIRALAQDVSEAVDFQHPAEFASPLATGADFDSSLAARESALARPSPENSHPENSTDDFNNSTPTGWWILSQITAEEVVQATTKYNARIVDLQVNAWSPTYYFTVTLVQNTGTYDKGWWWNYDLTEDEVNAMLAQNHARPTTIKAYDIGGGAIRFAVVMVENTGVDEESWWWYWGKTNGQLNTLLAKNKAQPVTADSYDDNGQTRFTMIMIGDSGSKSVGWSWWENESQGFINAKISSEKARPIYISPNRTGTFNAVLESCSKDCPGWGWWQGYSLYGVLEKADNSGDRIQSLEGYLCGSSLCFVTTQIANSPSDIKACDPSGCISEATLRNNICKTLANHVEGWNCLVGGVAPSYGGKARTSDTPPGLAMAPDEVTDIASVSKMITAIAVLQLLGKDGLSVGDKIGPYLYPDWHQGKNIGKITFKDLMTHTSGFGQLADSACEFDITYSLLETIVANGLPNPPPSPGDYGNCNFALLRELMPALLHKDLQGFANGSARAAQSSALYISYVNEHVLAPSGIPLSACQPPSTTYQIYSYPYPAGESAGDNWGNWSLQCGSGGWVLSANQIFAVVNTLVNSTTLLSHAQRQQMFSECLGWDCSVRSDCPSPYVCKNGDLNNGNGIYVWTYAGVFKCDVPVVVVVNSPLPSPYQVGSDTSGGDIIGLVENAYDHAGVPGTGAACP